MVWGDKLFRHRWSRGTIYSQHKWSGGPKVGGAVSSMTAPHTFVNMMATNEALMEKHSIILHVGSLNLKTSRTSHLNRVCELDSNWWVGSKIHSLLSAHHLIGAHFLTTESDKCMRLLTRLYGISRLHTLFLSSYLLLSDSNLV